MEKKKKFKFLKIIKIIHLYVLNNFLLLTTKQSSTIYIYKHILHHNIEKKFIL